MEIEGSDGSKTRLKPNSSIVFGRENGFHSNDLSVSRRHLSFDFNSQTDPRVSFEVLGKNPVWVFNKQHKDGDIKVFKRFQRGELGIDDLFCVSPKNPIWYALKKVVECFEERESKNEEISERVGDKLSESLESFSGFNESEDFGLDSVDLSNIDPVKEFGFLVIGHEFDRYPKRMIRDINQWNWFLDDSRRGDSDDDEEDSEQTGTTVRMGKRKNRRGDNGDDVDEEWTAESEGEEVTTDARKVQRPKYVTRSKEHGVHQKGSTSRNSPTKTSSRKEEEEFEDEETLGGFVVHDDALEEDEDVEADEEEEEEFVEDEDELEE